jgi:hypothetical protein
LAQDQSRAILSSGYLLNQVIRSVLMRGVQRRSLIEQD